MRKWLVAGVMATIAIVEIAAPAVAEPQGQSKVPEEWVCSGEDVVIVSAGRNGWIDDAKYHAVTLSVEGTFTPHGGTPQPISEFQTWAGGKDANSPDLITCTQDVSADDGTGIFEAHFEVTAIPVG